jgi:hypothetical protein
MKKKESGHERQVIVKAGLNSLSPMKRYLAIFYAIYTCNILLGRKFS